MRHRVALIFVLVSLLEIGMARFFYYQGFYRGADVAFCAATVAQDNLDGLGLNKTDPACVRIRNNVFSWRDTK